MSSKKKYVMMGISTILLPLGKMILSQIINEYVERRNSHPEDEEPAWDTSKASE